MLCGGRGPPRCLYEPGEFKSRGGSLRSIVSPPFGQTRTRRQLTSRIETGLNRYVRPARNPTSCKRGACGDTEMAAQSVGAQGRYDDSQGPAYGTIGPRQSDNLPRRSQHWNTTTMTDDDSHEQQGWIKGGRVRGVIDCFRSTHGEGRQRWRNGWERRPCSRGHRPGRRRGGVDPRPQGARHDVLRVRLCFRAPRLSKGIRALV